MQDWCEPEQRLVIQLARLGDFLQTTPLLAALGGAAVLVAPAVAPLARASRWVRAVHLLDPEALHQAATADESRRLRLARLAGLVRPLEELPVREVFTLNYSPLCAALAAAWPQARVRGWRLAGERLAGEPWTAFLLRLMAHRPLSRLHLCDVLASYADPEGPPLPTLDYRLEDQAREQAEALLPPGRPRVALQLGATHPQRRWPLGSFAELARSLAGRGVSLVLVGSAAERPLGRRLQRRAGVPVTDLMGRTDLATLAGVLAACDLLVSSDTGTLHLATAVGARVLGLYMGPAQVHETGPYGSGHLVLRAREVCAPCVEARPPCGGEAPCRRRITPAVAVRAAEALLSGTTAQEAARSLELPPEVEALAAERDAFGQRYRRLRPVSLGAGRALALALREAGRVIMRSAYTPDPQALAAELEAEYRPHPQEQDLAAVARAAATLAQAAGRGDALAARRVLNQVPALQSLAGLVGPGAPPRLEAACAAATQVLELCAERSRCAVPHGLARATPGG